MKKVIAILLAVFLLISMTACIPAEGESFTCGGRFIVVERNDTGSGMTNYILEDSETGVLYLLVYSVGNHGPHMALTVLLKPDGTPMIKEES